MGRGSATRVLACKDKLDGERFGWLENQYNACLLSLSFSSLYSTCVCLCIIINLSFCFTSLKGFIIYEY